MERNVVGILISHNFMSPHEHEVPILRVTFSFCPSKLAHASALHWSLVHM